MKRILTLAAFALFGFGTLLADQPGKVSKEAPKRSPETGMNRNRRIEKAPRKPGFKMQKQVSYLQFLPTVQDLYPEELAQIEELKKKDSAAASKQRMALQAKFRKQRALEMKSVREAVQAYKTEKNEAKLAEIKNLIGKKVDDAIANAKTRLETARKELESIRQLNISKQKLAMIERFYQYDIQRCETFLKKDRNLLIDEAVNPILNAPERKSRSQKRNQSNSKK